MHLLNSSRKVIKHRPVANTPTVVQYSTEVTAVDPDFSPITPVLGINGTTTSKFPKFASPPVTFRGKSPSSKHSVVLHIGLNTNNSSRQRSQMQIQCDSIAKAPQRRLVKPITVNSPFLNRKGSLPLKNAPLLARPRTTTALHYVLSEMKHIGVNTVPGGSSSRGSSRGNNWSQVARDKGSSKYSLEPSSHQMMFINPIDELKSLGKKANPATTIEDMLRKRIVEDGDAKTHRMQLITHIGKVLKARNFLIRQKYKFNNFKEVRYGDYVDKIQKIEMKN